MHLFMEYKSMAFLQEYAVIMGEKIRKSQGICLSIEVCTEIVLLQEAIRELNVCGVTCILA